MKQGTPPSDREAKEVYDVIIVGGGPAGLCAATYISMAKYKVLVLEAERTGGRLNDASVVRNYPGFLSIEGKELAKRMTEQAKSAGAEIFQAERSE